MRMAGADVLDALGPATRPAEAAKALSEGKGDKPCAYNLVVVSGSDLFNSTFEAIR